MATLTIHAGMLKAGSSSIQSTLETLPPDRGATLITLDDTANLSGKLAIAFDDPLAYRMARASGRTEGVNRRTEALHAQLAAKLDETRDRDAVLSAESLQNLTSESVERLLGLVKHSNVRIIVYVRDPVGFASSALQQSIKGGGDEWKPMQMFPRYRTLNEKFHRHGAEFVSYERSSLHNGCVVQDFCNRAGIRIDPSEVVNSNVGLSRDAVAMIYCRNVWRRGKPRSRATLLAEPLQAVGGPKLQLSPELLRRGQARMSDDNRWMQDRLGKDWKLKTGSEGPFVTRERDMLSVSQAGRDWLARVDEAYDGSDDWRAIGQAISRMERPLRRARGAARNATA